MYEEQTDSGDCTVRTDDKWPGFTNRNMTLLHEADAKLTICDTMVFTVYLPALIDTIFL